MRCFFLLALLFSGAAQAQNEDLSARVSQTPDCLQVENFHSENGLVKSIGILDTRLHLFVFAPRTTREFSLDVFDQTDETPNERPSRFELFAPDGTLERVLGAPKIGDWARYRIETQGKWGVWRLSVSGPQDLKAEGNLKPEKARNAFLVRTRGGVDLFLKPEPVARVRGLRLSEPRFGGANRHQFTLQNLDATRARFNVLREVDERVSRLQLEAEGARETRFSLRNDDRLRAGITLESVEYFGVASALIALRIENVRGVYGLGLENESRLFFNSSPLMKLARVEIETRDENGVPVAARVDISSPQTANESATVFTDSSGRGVYWALEGARFRIRATRGFESVPQSADFSSDSKKISLVLRARWPQMRGWLGGDSHCHTSYYDGTHTPRQMVEAAQSAGLSWLAVSEHAHGENIERARRANSEAALANSDPNFQMIPASEFTGPQFHANILGALVPIPEGADLPQILAQVRAADTIQKPIVCKLNHPTLGKTAAQIARETPDLTLLELWNSAEPEATQLWFDLLNGGQKIWADAASDSHHHINRELGSRRTYVFLGDEKPSPGAIIRALREGRSVLSRGAVLDFRVNGARPGATISIDKPTLNIHLETASARPIEAVEVVANGEVVRRFETRGQTRFAADFEIPAQSGWILARVLERGEKLPLALANPVWIR